MTGTGKWRAMALLVAAQVCVISLWFSSAAVLPAMLLEAPLSPLRQALLSSAVQAGFVAGALGVALSGIADRLDPRRVLAVAALAAASANALLLVTAPGGDAAIALRVVTGALLAGVYPVGMKIAVGWGTRDRGLLVGLLVGALTVGSAMPHLAALIGGADWRSTIATTSALAVAGALAALAMPLGPHHARAARFDARAILLAWHDRRIRLAYLGYLGHMWELYAMWAWIGAATFASYSLRLDPLEAARTASLTAFLAIALGGPACVLAGWAADCIGKCEVTIIAMTGSALAALATAASFGGPVWLTFVLVVLWGITVVPDSAQFSALVADAAPPELAGSLLTLQTALGFGLTIFTVQALPPLAVWAGWPAVLAGLALGPAFGIAAMLRLRREHG